MRAVSRPPSLSTTPPRTAATLLPAIPLLPHQPPVPAPRLLRRRRPRLILPRPQRPTRILLPRQSTPPFKRTISQPAKPLSSSNPAVPSTPARAPRPFPSDQSSHLSLEQSSSWRAFRGVGSFSFHGVGGFDIPSLHLISTILWEFWNFLAIVLRKR